MPAPEMGALSLYPKHITGAAASACSMPPTCPNYVMQGSDISRCTIPDSTVGNIQKVLCDPCMNGGGGGSEGDAAAEAAPTEQGGSAAIPCEPCAPAAAPCAVAPCNPCAAPMQINKQSCLRSKPAAVCRFKEL